ncbi:beta-lactamase family protein [Pseudoflavitalea sp. X16]|uniref:serine hydrolase domain-containing protein n=1 Tax=Paraflavitalea devenefica TaxID=2716334 RepID=UPI00141F0859|nr:serine hydrolase domain-containing protein [Paraflavitalea devenefica]NII26931.1 beta-lactamase family protein [Paraflavitalea devenefica]
MKPLVILSLALFLFPVAYAQKLNTKRLDSLFDMLQNRGLATGSVAISINGKIEYQKAIGFSLLDGSKRVAPDIYTKYRIGSVSKMLTAVMIFQLIGEGKLSLDEKLATWFPGLPNAGKITIEQMLYHRSGLHDYTKDTNFPDWMDKQRTADEMLKIITGKGTDFEPDTKADYCNTNYLLLSYIIEKIDRRPFAVALEKRIISKLRLANTYYGKPINIARNESSAYKYADSTWKKEKETNLGIHMGAGSVVSTPTDLITFIHQLFTGKLISQANLARMTTMIDGYGMGIFPYDFDGTKGYGHNGRIEEFYSAVRYYPDQKLAVTYITNGILYPRIDILEGILKISFNDAYTIPFSKPVALQGGDLDQYLGEYTSGDLPFKVVVRKENNTLIVEAAGRSMNVEPVATDYFMNLKTGTFFEFNPHKGGLQIKETDNVYYLSRSK